jgi:hypothetical protein
MEPTANTEEISLTAVQSTSEPPSTPSQGLYGLTKKLFNYVSGSNTPETTNKTTATDLSGKIVSAVSTPSLEVKFNSLKA